MEKRFKHSGPDLNGVFPDRNRIAERETRRIAMTCTHTSRQSAVNKSP